MVFNTTASQFFVLKNVSCSDNAVGNREADPADSTTVCKELWFGVVRGTCSYCTDRTEFKRMVSACMAHNQVDAITYTFKHT